MKGKTKFELTDIYTGEVQTIEQNNLVTSAQEDIWEWMVNFFMRQHADDPIGFSLQESLLAWFSSGIILLNDTVTLNASDYWVSKEAMKLSGSLIAWANDNYSGSDVWRGTLNLTESLNSEPLNEIVLVYDFPTDTANGTTSALGIVPDIEMVDLTAAPIVSNPKNDYLFPVKIVNGGSQNRDAGGSYAYNDELTESEQGGTIWKLNTSTKVVTKNYFNMALGDTLQEIAAYDYSLLITDASISIIHDDSTSKLYILRHSSRILYEISKSSAAILNTYDLSAIISTTNSIYNVKYATIYAGIIYYGDGVASDQRRIYSYDFVTTTGPTAISVASEFNTDIPSNKYKWFQTRLGQVEFKINDTPAASYDTWIRLNSTNDGVEQILTMLEAWNLIYYDKGFIVFVYDATSINYYVPPMFATKQNLDTPVTKLATQTMKLTYTLTWT